MQIRNQQSQQYRQQTISIRDIMKQQQQLVRQNNQQNNILPPQINNQFYSSDKIVRNIINLPSIVPPSHIQSQQSVTIPEYNQQQQLISRNKSPRRKKIFNNKNSNFNKNTSSNSFNQVNNNKPQFNKQNNSISAQSPQSFYTLNSQNKPNDTLLNNSVPNQSGFNTIPNMKKNNNTIFQQPNSNFNLQPRQPSGISLRSKHQSQHNHTEHLPKPVINQPNPYNSSTYNTGNINDKKQRHFIWKPSSNPLATLNRFKSKNPPVPVYQSQFYQTKPQDINTFNAISQKIGKTYQPFYQNNNQIKPNNNHILDALSHDFKQYENKPLNTSLSHRLSRQNSMMNSPSFAYPFQNSNHDISVNTSPPIIGGSVPVKEQHVTLKNIKIKQQVEGNKNYGLSPFEQNERQSIRQIPKRFQIIQSKVKKHDQQLAQMSKKLSETQINQLQTQKILLNQLIQKQQQLNLKQRQINSNLQQITRIQQSNIIKKQQILKYQLQLQQARRLEQLHKQNQKLYHQLIRRQKYYGNQAINKFKNNANYGGQKIYKQSSIGYINRDDSMSQNRAAKELLSPFTINHQIE